MIRLDRVELLHWDIQRHQVLPLAHGVTIITGENGSGKTSVLDAIKIALGARHPSAERRVEDYILKQAKPVAMIRLLIDNRKDESTGRRPFDPLGIYGSDTVTLAVVFKAIEETEYNRLYYILDGDQVPPLSAGEAGQRGTTGMSRALNNAAEYRQRLAKVGIGQRYIKLLRLPQGQVARLCALNRTELFDYLFDIIGGRTVLEEWESRLQELRERQLEFDGVRGVLDNAKKDLKRLGRKVARYRDFQKYEQQLRNIRNALPHRQLQEVAAQCARLDEQLTADREVLVRATQSRADALEAAHRAGAEHQRLLERETELKDRLKRTRASREKISDDRFEAKGELNQLETIRREAEGIAPTDPREIEIELEQTRVKIAQIDAAQQVRDEQDRALQSELERIERGLVPLPEEVEQFRNALRQAGIVHHVLAEVVEVTDAKWEEAIEGYLDRLRFAIVVQDPASWPAAAKLARTHRYPYGVLAPDIKGASPADQQSLFAMLEIKETRYRSLIARLLRRVVPDEPPSPLVPSPGSRTIVATDGFAVSRLEARCAVTDRAYLGRRALERRKQEIFSERSILAEQKQQGKQQRSSELAALEQLRSRLDQQLKRLAWIDAKDRHAELKQTIATLEGQLATIEEEIDSLERQGDAAVRASSEALSAISVCEERAGTADLKIADIEKRIEHGEQQVKQADEQRGRLAVTDLPELTPEAQGLVAEHSAETLSSMIEQTDGYLAGFPEDERDSMLPTNFQRLGEETGAIESRITKLGEELEALNNAAQRAQAEYQQATRRVFRAYFARLNQAAEKIEFRLEGRLEQLENGRFSCDVKVGVGEKTPVHHDSEQLSGGQKAALSILMGMTAVSLESDGAGFFLIDEPFSNSDLHKINELGRFLDQTGAQYLISMPTTADLDQCGDWLKAAWICTRSRGGTDPHGAPVLADPLKICFVDGARGG